MNPTTIKTMLLHIFLGVLFILSPFAAQTLRACSCHPLPSIYQAFKQSEAVFAGKILSTEDVKINGYTERHHRVQLLENFKGVTNKEISISAGVVESSCFWGDYTVGESYLIYSYSKDKGVFSAGKACSRIAALEDAEDQIFFIRELLKGKPEPQVYGRVVIQENDLQTNEVKEKALSGIEVQVKSDSKTVKTLSDQNGFYRFNNLPSEDYVLNPLVPVKYRAYFPDSENFAVLENKKICRSRYGKISLSDGDCLLTQSLSDGFLWLSSCAGIMK